MRGSIHSWKRSTTSSSPLMSSRRTRGDSRSVTTRLSHSTPNATTEAPATSATLVKNSVDHTEVSPTDWYHR